MMAEDNGEKETEKMKPGTSPYIITMLIGSGTMFLIGIVLTLLEIRSYRG